MFKRKGQSTLEYALIIAVVIAGLLLMQHYLKRGYSGRLRSAADEMGEQFDPSKYQANFTSRQLTNVTQNITAGVATTKHRGPQIQNRTGSENITPWAANETLQTY